MNRKAIKAGLIAAVGLVVSSLTLAAVSQDFAEAATSGSTAWSWGDNTQGNLGDGSASNRTLPAQMGTEADWAKIAVGFGHGLALKSDGTLWTWGANFHGQLGDGTTTHRSVPVSIGTDTWIAVAAGTSHSLGIRSDGTLWAWGFNYSGQLGDGSTTSSTSPVKIGNSNTWMAIDAGDKHSMALRSNGTLWAWGGNGGGQIGDGTTIGRTSPVQVGIETTWVEINAGFEFSTARKTNGTLWTWGGNQFGALGDGTTTDRTSPAQVGSGTNWSGIAAGYSFALGLEADGTLWSWGYNASGQLGDGTTTNRTSPIKVGMSSDWVSVRGGADHTVGLRAAANPPPTTTTLPPATTTTVAPAATPSPFVPSAAFNSPSPVGSLDLISTAPGGARLAGWALDPETPNPVSVHAYVDGVFAGALNANASRPDIGSAFPTYGDAHGFDQVVAMGPGFHNVCVYAINQGMGDHTLVGCRSVAIGADPFGSFDLASQAPGGARVAGWALDPSTSNSIGLHVYVDGAIAGALTAGSDRPDIAQAFPGYGSTHGFDSVVPIPDGFHTVCAYGINEGPGSNSLIGCRWVMLNSEPVGSLDVVQATSGGLRVAGWALDPNTADSVSVHVYVDNAFSGSFNADTNRSDIAQAFPGYGAAHGYDQVIPAGPGPHTVCAYAINTGPGPNSLIGCRSA